MKPLFRIKLGICYNCLVFNPITSHFLELAKTVPMAVFGNECVDNPQASCSCCYGGFSVWLLHNISLGPFAVCNTWSCNLKMSWVQGYAFVSSSFATQAH